MSGLDATDLAILRILAQDATKSAAEIGRAVGIGQPAAWRRIRRLTDQGVIAGRRVVLDRAALGFGVTVFLGIKLAAKGRTGLEDFERAVTATYDNIVEKGFGREEENDSDEKGLALANGIGYAPGGTATRIG